MEISIPPKRKFQMSWVKIPNKMYPVQITVKHFKILKNKKKEKLDFSLLNQEKYNLPFNFNELSEALKNLMIQLLVMIKFIIKFFNIYQTIH